MLSRAYPLLCFNFFATGIIPSVLVSQDFVIYRVVVVPFYLQGPLLEEGPVDDAGRRESSNSESIQQRLTTRPVELHRWHPETHSQWSFFVKNHPSLLDRGDMYWK
jgi:hypothetical protein